MEINFEPRQKYILVNAKGKIDLQTEKELFTELILVCLKEKLFKVIVDYREVDGFISIIGRLDYLESIDALHQSYLKLNMPKLKIAYLAPQDLVITEQEILDRRETLSFDTMATHDIESAKRWVME